MEQLGASMEKGLESFFTKWGTCKLKPFKLELFFKLQIFNFFFFVLDCARYPVSVLFFGIAVAGALAVGIVYLEVTIDPVEIWAAPTSRSRQEKNHFDKNFSPFYRTAQVILHAEGLEPVCQFFFLFFFFLNFISFIFISREKKISCC